MGCNSNKYSKTCVELIYFSPHNSDISKIPEDKTALGSNNPNAAKVKNGLWTIVVKKSNNRPVSSLTQYSRI